MTRSVGPGAAVAAMAAVMIVGCAVAPAPGGAPRPSSMPETSPEPAATRAPSGPPAPPEAILVVDGTAAAAGEPGSWAIGGHGNDSPWISSAALDAVRVPSSAPLTVRFPDHATVGTWAARAARAVDTSGRDTAPVGGRFQAGGPPVTDLVLGSLAPGAWVIQVHAVFSDDRGEATYYWLVVVT